MNIEISLKMLSGDKLYEFSIYTRITIMFNAIESLN